MPRENSTIFARDVTIILVNPHGKVTRITHTLHSSVATDFAAGFSLLSTIEDKFFLRNFDLPLTQQRLHTQDPLLLQHKNSLQWFELNYLADLDLPIEIYQLRNVTDRELALSEAERSADVLRSVLQEVPSGGWDIVMDRATAAVQIVTYSKELKALLGFEEDELPNHPDAWFARVHPDDQGPMENLTRLKIGGLSPFFSTQYRIRHKQGHYVTLYTHDSTIQAGDNELVRWTGSVWDLSALKTSLQSANRLATLVEFSASPILGCDANGQINLWNKAAQELLGYSNSNFGQLNIKAIITSNESRVLEKHLQKVSGHGQLPPLETMAIDCQGRKFPVLLSISTFAETSSHAAGLSVVIQDITILKQVQEELLQAKMQADSASKTKNIFLANVSHEVRTPLAAIKGFMEIIDGYLDSPAIKCFAQTNRGADFANEKPLTLITETSKMVKRVNTNVLTLERLINDILDVSKLEAGKLDLECKIFDICAMYKDLTVQFTAEAQKKNLAFNYTWDPRIHRHVQSDQLRIKQILTNLLSNAFKYTINGHVDFNVFLSPRAQMLGSQELIFRIRDTGVGIPVETAKTLFQPFERGNAEAAKMFRGTGIGLFLSRNIAKHLGGQVSIVDSEVGVGSTFEFRISLPCTMRKAKEPNTATMETRSLSGTNILVVEDNEDLLILAKTILENEGALVDLAENGLQGVEKAFDKRYDVILMDLQMPQMDGYEAIRVIKANPNCQAKVVAVTAHAMHGERERCLNAGFDDYLAKPMQRGLIVKTLLNLQ